MPDNQSSTIIDDGYGRIIKFTKTWIALAAVDVVYPIKMITLRPEQTIKLSTTSPSSLEEEYDEGNIIEVVRFGNIDTIKQYLSRENVHVDDNLNENGWTLLHLACRFNHTNIVDMLIVEYGANVHKKDSKGCTALHFASGHGAGNRDIVEQLLTSVRAKGPNQAESDYINEKDNEGKTAIHTASLYGHKSVLNILLDKGNGISSKDEHGWTALHFASELGDEEIVQMLLEYFSKYVTIDESDNYGRTALHLAVIHGHTDVVKILLDSGANVDSLDEDKLGDDAIDIATTNGYDNIMEFLNDYRRRSAKSSRTEARDFLNRLLESKELFGYEHLVRSHDQVKNLYQLGNFDHVTNIDQFQVSSTCSLRQLTQETIEIESQEFAQED